MNSIPLSTPTSNGWIQLCTKPENTLQTKRIVKGVTGSVEMMFDITFLSRVFYFEIITDKKLIDKKKFHDQKSSSKIRLRCYEILLFPPLFLGLQRDVIPNES